MNTLEIQRKILAVVSGLVFLSVLSLIGTLPGIIQATYPGSNPKQAAIAAFVGMILHLVILYGFFTVLKANKRGHPADKGLTIGLGILLLIFGLIIMDGAFASLEHVLFVSILMFVVVIFDFVAALATFGILLLKPKKKN